MNPSNALRVAHIIPSLDVKSGGVPEALIGWVIATRASAKVSVISTRTGERKGDLERIQSRIPDISIHLFAQVGHRAINVSPRLFWWLFKNIRNYDVVHIHTLLHPISTVCALIARLRNVPYIVCPHGTLSNYALNGKNGPAKRTYVRWFDSRTMNGAYAMHYTAPMEPDIASRHCPLAPWRVIASPVELQPAQPSDLDVSAPYFLFSSRLLPNKRLDVCVDAFARVARDHPTVRLLIAGTGSDEIARRVARQAAALGVGTRVQFLGNVNENEKTWLLVNARALVLTSEDENFAVAVAESLSVGRPVIVSEHVGTSPDVAAHNAGLVCPLDASQFADAMARVLIDEQYAIEMGANGSRFAGDHYSTKTIGRELMALYSDAAHSQ